MIITISGDPGSGKSTVAKALAKTLRFKHYSGGDMRGQVAVEHGMTIDELNKVGETEDWTDREIDKKITELGRKERDFVIDSRVAWHFIPHSIRIYLKVDPEAAAKRVFADRKVKGRRDDEKSYRTVKEVESYLATRVGSDKKRFEKYYGVDYTDPSHYDLVIDTTTTSADDALRAIIALVHKRRRY